jgi:hypothetical protein
MARRGRPVRKLLDEPLKVAGLLTLRSCGVVFCVYGVCYFVLELVLGLWSRLLGAWSLFGPISCAIAVGAVLRVAEAFDDEHAVPSALRFFLSRRTRHVYAAGRSEGFTPHAPEPLDVVRGAVASLRGQPQLLCARPVAEWMHAGLCRPRKVAC